VSGTAGGVGGIPIGAAGVGSSGFRELNEACFDFLNIEVVDYILRSTPDRQSRLVKLERIGFIVGHKLIERASKDKPRFQEQLDLIRFICKDFWKLVFKKQIDNLRTNHQGIYVLQDFNFRWLTHISACPAAERLNVIEPKSLQVNSQILSRCGSGSSEFKENLSYYLQFPCGLIRGALTNLGLPCTVSADSSDLPKCTFTINMKSL